MCTLITTCSSIDLLQASSVAYRRRAQISSLRIYYLEVHSSKSNFTERHTFCLCIKLNILSNDAFCRTFLFAQSPPREL